MPLANRNDQYNGRNGFKFVPKGVIQKALLSGLLMGSWVHLNGTGAPTPVEGLAASTLATVGTMLGSVFGDITPLIFANENKLTNGEVDAIRYVSKAVLSGTVVTTFVKGAFWDVPNTNLSTIATVGATSSVASDVIVDHGFRFRN